MESSLDRSIANGNIIETFMRVNEILFLQSYNQISYDLTTLAIISAAPSIVFFKFDGVIFKRE